MRRIPVNLKKLLFNKEAHEPLTSEDQEIWENLVASEQAKDVNIDLDDATFRTAFELYLRIKQDNIAPWEKFEQEVLQQCRPPSTEAAPLRVTRFRLPVMKWAAVALVLIVVVGSAVFINLKQRKQQPVLITRQTGYNETDTFTLPDGTTVVLNALSSLTYPSAFTSGERHVQLSGEAYFIVISNPSDSFRVSALQTDVTATGTEFNVKAYSEDSMVTASLKKGVISVKSGHIRKKIKEGDQAIVSGQQIRVNDKVNFRNVEAWKQKYIALEGEDIKSVMRQIARYYHVLFRIEGNPPFELSNQLETAHSLEEMITALDLIADEAKFHYDKEANIVIVSEEKIVSNK
jgi:ferric-dicitrate binding protein FerR (iron transport regulator)